MKKNYLKYTNKIDLFLTQFGYENWVGNLNEKDLCVASAREKLDRISLQADIFEPKFTVPFASFVYFSHPENFHTNDCQNTPRDVQEFFLTQNVNSELIVMKPWDKFSLDRDLTEQSETQRGIEHWVSLFDKIKPHVADEVTYSFKDISVESDLYRKKYSNVS